MTHSGRSPTSHPRQVISRIANRLPTYMTPLSGIIRAKVWKQQEILRLTFTEEPYSTMDNSEFLVSFTRQHAGNPRRRDRIVEATEKSVTQHTKSG